MFVRKSNLAKTLSLLMDANGGLTEAELARKTKLSQPTINRILKGTTQRPHYNALKTISEFFKITVNQLLGEDHLSSSNIANFPALNLHVLAKVPLIPWETVKQWPSYKKQCFDNPEITWIPVFTNITDQAFALKVIDSSMEHKFSQGNILVFDPMKETTDRSFVVVHLKTQEIVFKQILFDGHDRYLKSFNRDLADHIIIMNNEDQIKGTLVQAFANY